MRVSNNNTYTIQTYEEFSGTLEICANGRYTTVCGLNETNFNASVLASVVCNDLGYPGKLLIVLNIDVVFGIHSHL